MPHALATTTCIYKSVQTQRHARREACHVFAVTDMNAAFINILLIASQRELAEKVLDDLCAALPDLTPADEADALRCGKSSALHLCTCWRVFLLHALERNIGQKCIQ